MDREQTILRYREETDERIQAYRDQMGRHLMEHAEQMELMIKDAMDRLGEVMKQQQKEYVSFLYISLLKTDLINHNYRFLLHALNHQWYLDEEPVEVYFSAGNLFEPLEQIWEYLTEESRKYIGVINQYDIWHIIFEELKHIDTAICQILRYRLRAWEEKDIFANVIRPPYWLLKWGEYRDQSEFVIQTDRTEQDKDRWKKEVRAAAHKPETLVFSYWYQGMYENSTLNQLDMQFVVFEEAELHNLTFNSCNMEGSRFSDSSLENCSFNNCNLWGADFSDCRFKSVSFEGAELSGAVFPTDCVPFLNLAPEQLQVILLKREAKQ